MESRMRHLFLAAAILFTAFTAGATATNQRTVHVPANMVVQTSWLAAHLSDKNLVILHVGANQAGYDAGHIPGARYLALSEIAVRRDGILYNLPETKDLKTTFERLRGRATFLYCSLWRHVQSLCTSGIRRTQISGARKQCLAARWWIGSVGKRTRNRKDDS